MQGRAKAAAPRYPGANEASGFADPRRVAAPHALTTPAELRQTFETGEQVIAAPEPDIVQAPDEPPAVVDSARQPVKR